MKTNILDQYHGDPTFVHLYAAIRDTPELQSLLKSASFTTESVELLPSTAFAWEAERRFPVHTKQDTAASIVYRNKIASYVPIEVDRKLAIAAQIYGLSAPDFTTVKQAAAEVTYALPEHKRLPLDTAEQVKLAEDVLCRDHKKLTVETRADAFSRLVKAAAQHDVEVRPFTYKMAGLTTCNNQTLKDWLDARSEAATDPLYKTAFAKLSSGLQRAGTELSNRNDLVKLASTIQQLDEGAGLTKYYDRKLPDPLQTVFNTEKVAEEMCDVAGKKVACAKLMHLPDAIWEQIDATELSKIAEDGNVTEFKQAFDTLPLDLKVVLRSYV